MATTTPNFGWTVPTSTDLVKDGATAIETLGDGIDASFVDLKGGTTGQVLAKASNTDLDYTWSTPQVGDITAVTAGIGISGGGTGGDVTITNSMATAIDAKGDLVAGTGADAFSRLAVGANDTVLTADSTTATGLKWAAPAGGGGLTLIKTQTIGSAVSSVNVTSAFSADYDNYLITVEGGVGSAGGGNACNIKLGSTVTGYYSFGYYGQYNSTTVVGTKRDNFTSWDFAMMTANQMAGTIFLMDPYLAKNTVMHKETAGASGSSDYVESTNGFLSGTTSYTDFTIFTTATTMTGGTIRVYGYKNS